MPTRTLLASLLVTITFFTALTFVYRLGYSRGGAEERLDWIVIHENGAFTARENPAHPILKAIPGRRMRFVPTAKVNSIPVTYSH